MNRIETQTQKLCKQENEPTERYVKKYVIKWYVMIWSPVLYHLCDTSPALNTDVSEFEQLFVLVGYNGCIRSFDWTHVVILSCASWVTITHLGPKLNIPSRMYNAKVRNFWQILGTTWGHSSTWNDKSIILYDELIEGVHKR